jgi:hypothetical protein
LNQRLKDAFEHCFSALEHLVIPESNHAKAATREILRPLEIFDHRVRVLTPVELNDQSRSNANEVHDESTDRDLSAEAITTQSAMAQVVPETPLGVSRVRA